MTHTHMHSSCARVCECAHLLVSLPSASISVMHKNTNFPPSLSHPHVDGDDSWNYSVTGRLSGTILPPSFRCFTWLYVFVSPSPIIKSGLEMVYSYSEEFELSEGPCRISVQTNIVFIRFLLSYFILCFKLGNEMYCSYQQTKLPINCCSFIVKNRINSSFIFRFGW